MKKSALSVAAAVTLAAIGPVAISDPAHAATLVDDGTNKVDLHGRLRLGWINDDGNNRIDNISSRFGFRFNHKASDNLSVFANTEFRFKADERNSNAMEVRNTFIGVDLNRIGRIYAGNFDSIYYQQVSSLLDIMENNGSSIYRALNSGGQRARGDSIAFDSASFGGLRFGVSVKQQPEEETGGVVTQEEATSFMAYAGFKAGGLNLAVAFDQANEDMKDGSEDSLIGLRADYAITPALRAGALYETQGDMTHIGAMASFNYGKGAIYGTVSQMDFDGDASDTQYVLGANYRFSRPMYVFAEYASSTDAEVGAIDRNIITVGARYNF